MLLVSTTVNTNRHRTIMESMLHPPGDMRLAAAAHSLHGSIGSLAPTRDVSVMPRGLGSSSVTLTPATISLNGTIGPLAQCIEDAKETWIENVVRPMTHPLQPQRDNWSVRLWHLVSIAQPNGEPRRCPTSARLVDAAIGALR